MWLRQVYVDNFTEINEILKVAKECTVLTYGDWTLESRDKFSLSTTSYYKVAMVEFTVTTKYWDGKPATYHFRLDGEPKAKISPVVCYRTLNQYYRNPDFSENKFFQNVLGWDETTQSFSGCSAGPLLGHVNDSGEEYLYEYDLNSAYSYQLLQPIPDTTQWQLYSDVEEGHVGFMFDCKLSKVSEGYADIVFPLMPSPYPKFVDKWYGKKKKAPKESREREEAKQMMNVAIGFLQRKNPFIRAMVVHGCNEFVAARLDENSVMWNTDAIYSRVPRPDLEIGNEIGQFKLEKEGLCRYRGDNYQWVGEVPHYRHIPRSWFTKDFNILTDKLPKFGNIYEFDKEKFEIVEVKNNEI